MTDPDHRDLIEAEEARRDLGSLFGIVLGPTIWAVHFLLVYVGAAVVCERMPGWIAEAPMAVAGVTVAAVLAIVLVTVPSVREFRTERRVDTDDDSRRGRTRFLAHAALLLSGLSLVAVVYQTLPAVYAVSCV